MLMGSKEYSALQVSIHGTYNNLHLLEFDSWSEDLMGSIH